ncbi:ABC transporter substrate-binding protein [Microbacterium sp. A588]
MKRHWTRGLRSTLAAVAVAGVALAGVTACASAETSPGGEANRVSGGEGCENITEPIRVGTISPLSGPAAALGALNDNAVLTAVKVFNEREDICGQPIELVREDDKGDPATAISLGRKLLSEGVEIFTSTGMNETEDALVPVLMDAGAVIVANTGKSSLLENDNFFSVLTSEAQYSQAVVDQSVAQGWDKVGILNDNTAWGNGHTAGLEQGFADAGVEIVKIVEYSPTAVDMTTPIKQLQSAGAETLILAGASAIPAAVDGITQSGWDPNLISWGAYLAYLTPPENLPDTLVEGCARSLPADQAPDGLGGLGEAALAVLEAGEAEYGDSPSVLQAISLYDQLLVIKAAVEASGSTTGADVAAAIKQIEDLPSVWPDMKLTFSEDNHTGYPLSSFSFCTLNLGPFGIPYTSPDTK